MNIFVYLFFLLLNPALYFMYSNRKIWAKFLIALLLLIVMFYISAGSNHLLHKAAYNLADYVGYDNIRVKTLYLLSYTLPFITNITLTIVLVYNRYKGYLIGK